MYGAICLNQLLQTVQSSIPKDFSQKYFRMHAAKIKPLWYILVILQNLSATYADSAILLGAQRKLLVRII